MPWVGACLEDLLPEGIKAGPKRLMCELDTGHARRSTELGTLVLVADHVL